MRGMKLGVLAILLSLGVTGPGPLGCGTKRPQSATATPARPEADVERSVEDGIRVLAEGNYPAADGFIVLARDPETYAALRAMIDRVPELRADFFEENAVVAAFLGQRRTSGYSVDITLTADGGLRVAEISPSPDTPVKMALSAPFKIASVPVGNKRPLRVVLDDTWRGGALRPYRVTSGEIVVKGGSRGGAPERSPVTGAIRLVREGNLTTFIFNLRSAGGAHGRALNTIATGITQPDGRVRIPSLDAGALTGLSPAPLRATASFTNNDEKFSLSLISLATGDPGGDHSVEGRLEATASSPPPSPETGIAP